MVSLVRHSGEKAALQVAVNDYPLLGKSSSSCTPRAALWAPHAAG